MNADDESSAELVERASRGDGGAVEALVQRLLPELERFIRGRAGRLILRKESGSDLTQSVCREMLEGLAQERLEYRGEAEFKQWLFRAAELKLMNRQRFYRRERRDAAREAKQDGGSLAERLAHSFHSPSQAALRREEIERLEKAFQKLDERSRRITVMFHLEGKAHPEIAAELGIEAGHSRTLLARAMSRLARLAT